MDRATGFAIIVVIGLFSVPAPPTRDRCVRRGFFVGQGNFPLAGQLGNWTTKSEIAFGVMWRINQNHASVNAAGLSASLNLRRPDRGLVDLVWQESPWPKCRLFQIRHPLARHGFELLDAYVRGADLVASYCLPSNRALAMQVYWRLLAYPEFQAAGIELIVSVQTELLDDDPCLTVHSELPQGELLQASGLATGEFAPVGLPEPTAGGACRCTGAGVFLDRLAAGGGVLQAVHPADFSTAVFESDAGADVVRCRFALFEERLEKGVLRRARACGLLLGQTPDTEAAAWGCYRDWLAAEAPLTA
jgi:hypothetical protein